MADPNTANNWATNVAKVGAASWKDAMKSKGIPRLQTGVQRAVTTKTQRITNLLSAVINAIDGAISGIGTVLNAPSDVISALYRGYLNGTARWM